MLLTFLGLTLVTTTSTELQIATNYKWSQQALYNAEAGIEAGKIILRNIPTDWTLILPPARPAWPAGTTPAAPSSAPSSTADQWGNPARNWENAGCDTRANEGYGAVLDDRVGGVLLMGQTASGPYQNVGTFRGQAINGSFSLWVRRDVVPNGANLQDDPSNVNIVLTSEGVAPARKAIGTTTAAARQQAAQAVRVLQVKLTRPVLGTPHVSQAGTVSAPSVCQ